MLIHCPNISLYFFTGATIYVSKVDLFLCGDRVELEPQRHVACCIVFLLRGRLIITYLLQNKAFRVICYRLFVSNTRSEVCM